MLLLLAGTGEARQIATALAKAAIPAVASLAGATRWPNALDLPTRIGGFGGETGFVDYLQSKRITAILDATHPFASQISLRTARVAADRQIPNAQFLRPEWVPAQGDDWQMVEREEDVAGLVPDGSTVFLATGRQTLNRYAGIQHCRLICRQIDPPEGAFPFPNGEYLVGRPPFFVADEMALFTRLGVDWLVVKNAGGAASFTKLEAARNLHLPVAMIRRPSQPSGPKLETVAAALDWVKGLKW